MLPSQSWELSGWEKRENDRAYHSDSNTCVFGLYYKDSGKVFILQDYSATVWGYLGPAEAGIWGAIAPLLYTPATLTRS